jgi:TRAP-type C4-dicarboxylate transport system substrate-binding protein
MSVRLIWFALLAVLSVRAVPAAADPRDPVRLRVGTQAIDGSRYMKDIVALGTEIEKRTRGSVQLDWVSGGRLGDDAAMADLIARGTLDGGGLSDAGLLALVPEMSVWSSPGLFRSYEEVDRATAAVDATVRDLFAKRGLTFAMWADLGFSQVFSSQQITSVHDVLQQAAPWLAMPLDGTLTEAILSGRAHAWAMPPLYMLAIGSTKARSMSSLRYRYVIGGLVFSGAAWSKLTAAEQKIVLEVCRERAPRIRASWRKETERGVAALRKSGVMLRAASEVEVANFAESASKTREAQAREPGFAKLGAKVVAATVAR